MGYKDYKLTIRGSFHKKDVKDIRKPYQEFIMYKQK